MNIAKNAKMQTHGDIKSKIIHEMVEICMYDQVWRFGLQYFLYTVFQLPWCPRKCTKSPVVYIIHK